MKWKLILPITIIIVIILGLLCYIRAIVKANIANGCQGINAWLTKHCRDQAILHSANYPWTEKLRSNWHVIRDEFDAYHRTHEIPAYADINMGSSGATKGWKALFLRAFCNNTEMMARFPKTKAIIDSIKRGTTECTTAYFSMLEPGTRIAEHRGIYKGVIRYHLGLYVPQKWEDCFIVVDGMKMHWREGQDIMFDDMYFHHVQNNTTERRVVLFLDIRRDFQSSVINAINGCLLRNIKSNDELLSTIEKANILSARTKRDDHQSNYMDTRESF